MGNLVSFKSVFFTLLFSMAPVSELRGAIPASALVITIAAGIPTARFEEGLGEGARARPATQGGGRSRIAPGEVRGGSAVQAAGTCGRGHPGAGEARETQEWR